jgi:hypothetical protein
MLGKFKTFQSVKMFLPLTIFQLLLCLAYSQIFGVNHNKDLQRGIRRDIVHAIIILQTGLLHQIMFSNFETL